MRDVRNNPESRFYQPEVMRSVNERNQWLQERKIEELENRIKKLEEKANPSKPKPCENCEEYNTYCFTCQKQFIQLL